MSQNEVHEKQLSWTSLSLKDGDEVGDEHGGLFVLGVDADCHGTVVNQRHFHIGAELARADVFADGSRQAAAELFIQRNGLLLAGSSRLFNFFDSVFAISQSAKDQDLRYIKQVKVSHGKFEYGPENVITCEIVHDYAFVHFRLLDTCPEREHLKERTEKDIDTRDLNIRTLYEQGKSYREIADELNLSKSLVGNVVNRLKEKGQLGPVQPSTDVYTVDDVDTCGQQPRLPFNDD